MAQSERRSLGPVKRPSESETPPPTTRAREHDVARRPVGAAGAAPGAIDFLGLDLELKSRTQAAPADAGAWSTQPSSFAAASAPTGNAPLVAAPPVPAQAEGTWSGPAQPGMLARMQPTPGELARALPPAETQRSNSWLLDLDDARSGRAGLEPVIADPARAALPSRRPAALEASFAEAPPILERASPWIVRGLLASAAASFVFVVVHTLLARHVDNPKVAEAPLAPVESVGGTNVQLSDPGVARSSAARASGSGSERPATTPRAAKPAIANARRDHSGASATQGSASPAEPRSPQPFPRTEDLPSYIEIPPPEFAPTLVPGSSPAGATQGGAAVHESAPGAGAAALDASDSTTPAGPTSRGVQARAAAPASERGTATVSAAVRPDRASSPAERDPGHEVAASSARREQVARWLETQGPGSAPFDGANGHGAPYPASGSCALATANLAGVIAPREPGGARNAAAAAASTTSATAALAVWEGATVPADQIASRVRVLTPGVGSVRVLLDSGDAREGRLYAVGLGQVWIDTDLGRVALARERIERLEQIRTQPAAPPAPETLPETASARQPDAVSPASGPRMRVRTPGGLFYGQIVAREGNAITLLSDEGARITLESGDVEPAPLRTTVVRRSTVSTPAARPAAPAPPAPAAEPEYDPDNPHGLH